MSDARQAITPQPLVPDHLGSGSSEECRAGTVNPALRDELHYRQLERTYYQSRQYAAMVERYPLLRSSIAACRSMALISDAPPQTARVAALLHWERSHGEA